ncbi:MAG TPA: WHG domain-containing protein [Jiangellaceae bacterium]|nr:WHG domain-containing protein [Jiangellaceae bacterium]
MPRAGLTRERVVAEAAVIADEVGFERFTLAAVAARCGVSLPGLYKHIEGLAGIKRDIAVLSVDELTETMSRAAVGLAGKDALAAIAHAYRRYVAEHPGRAAAAVVEAPDPDDAEHAAAADRAIAVLAAALKGYGIEQDDGVHAIRYLRAVLHGFSALEAARGFGLPQAVDTTFEHIIDALDAAFARWPTTTPA